MHAWLLHRLQGAAQGWRVGLGMRAQNKMYADYAEVVTRDANGKLLSARPAFRNSQGTVVTFNRLLKYPPRTNFLPFNFLKSASAANF